MTEYYNIIRFYQDPSKKPRTMRKHLTLEQAQKHCNDPETSSMTASTACRGNKKTQDRWHGLGKHWFDGFTSMGRA